MGDQPPTAADRLRARVNAGPTIFDHRPAWISIVENIAKQGEDSAESLDVALAEGLVKTAELGSHVPAELLVMARAYLQPRYRDDRDRSRTHDPATSKDAANDERRPTRARSHAHRLLGAYASVHRLDAHRVAGAYTPETPPYYGGLTAPEAALIIGKPGAWRRTPELHQDGLIELVPWSEYLGPVPPELVLSSAAYPEMPATRPTVYGKQSRVFRITEAGRAELRRMNREERAWNQAREEKAARKAARGNKA